MNGSNNRFYFGKQIDLFALQQSNIFTIEIDSSLIKLYATREILNQTRIRREKKQAQKLNIYFKDQVDVNKTPEDNINS